MNADFSGPPSARFAPEARRYFDTATQGIPPLPALEELKDAIGQWRTGRASWRVWEEATGRYRHSAARLLGCPTAEVSVIHSVIEAAALVAAALPPGRVLVPRHEFRSNVVPWAWSRNPGLVVEAVDPGEDLTRSLLARIDDDVTAVAVSSHQSWDGRGVDLSALATTVQSARGLLFVDATQSLGGAGQELSRAGADVIAAAGYKWLLGARGAGIMRVREEAWERLPPAFGGPHAAASFDQGEQYGFGVAPRQGAGRYDQSPAWLPVVSAAAAAGMLAEMGQAALHEHAVGLARLFDRECRTVLGREPVEGDQESAIRYLPLEDPPATARALEKAGMRATVRPQGIRAAFHLYNTAEDVREFVNVLGGQASRAATSVRM